MERLRLLSGELLTRLHQQGLTDSDLQALSLFLTMVALLLALLSFRKAGRTSPAANVQRLGARVDQSSIQLQDLKSEVGNNRENLLEELRFLRERVQVLEQQLDSPDLRDAEKEALTKDKKKTDDTKAERTPPVPEESRAGGIFGGLKKTREVFFSRLSSILNLTPKLDAQTLEALEELLITSDLGVRTSQKLLAQLKETVSAGEELSPRECQEFLKQKILSLLGESPLGEMSSEKISGKPRVILVVGVNGVGKTTTIGKLASRFASRGAKVLLGAADTFRAAAGEQIEVWAERAGVEVLRGADQAKPATVAYEAVHKAMQENFDVVLIDTAGRLHTRVNLMNELSGVLSVIARELPGAPHETILVVDATTGQNALEQAREFHSRVQLTGIVVTKLDGTPKGGIVVAIRDELGVPIRYVGVGESAADLRPFSPTEYTEAMFSDGESGSPYTASLPKAELRAVRRRPSVG